MARPIRSPLRLFLTTSQVLNDPTPEAVGASKKSLTEEDNGGGIGESESSSLGDTNSEPSDKPTGESSEGSSISISTLNPENYICW